MSTRASTPASANWAKAQWQVAPAVAGQATYIRADLKTAEQGMADAGETELKRWAHTPIGPIAPTPVEAMQLAARMTYDFGHEGTDRAAAEELFAQLETSRDALSVVALGKVVDDIALRNSTVGPAHAFAEALTRACRVVNEICDNGSVSHQEAKAAGRRLSTRQAVQAVQAKLS